MMRLDVSLGQRSYPIAIGRDVLARAGELVPWNTKRAVVVTNAIVAAHHLSALRASLDRAGVAIDVVLIPDGEQHKNWDTLNDVLTRLLELKVDRTTPVVALGGGVVGDLAGFASATYLRRRSTSAASRTCRCPRRCSRRSTRRSAERRPSTIGWART